MKKCYENPVCKYIAIELIQDILTMSNAGDGGEEAQEGISWGDLIPKQL